MRGHIEFCCCNTPNVSRLEKLEVQEFAERVVLRATLQPLEASTGRRCIRGKYPVKVKILRISRS